MPRNNRDNGRFDEPATSPTLGRYWDEIVQGMPAAPGDLDPTIAATVRHLHARDDAPGASAAFATRLWAELEDQMTTSPSPLTISSSRNAHPPTFIPRPPAPARQDSAPRRTTWRPLRSAASYALTVALVLAVIAVYLTFGQSRLFQVPLEEPTSLAAIQAQSATPPASAALDIQIDLATGEVPVNSLDARLANYTLPPGAASTWTAGCCTGPRLTLVLSGSYSVQSEAATRVLRRAGSAQWESVEAGTELTLESGDALLSRMEASFEASNAGNEPVDLVDGQLFAGNINSDPVPTGWEYHNLDTLYETLTAPDGSLALRLREVTLEGGGTLPPPPGAALQLALSVDERATIGAVDDFTRRNLGKTPATLYVLTLTPTDEATPAVNPQPFH